MKTVRVVAAVIKQDGKILATERGYGEFKGLWEFPGGKIEAGESPQEALKREIKEELDVDIDIQELITTIEFNYPEFHLSMDCFWCEIISGIICLREANSARWLTGEELSSIKWLPADQVLCEKYIRGKL